MVFFVGYFAVKVFSNYKSCNFKNLCYNSLDNFKKEGTFYYE